MPENTASVTIGKRSKSAGCFFNGMIDEVVIFNRALSEEEVQEAIEGVKLAVESMGKLITRWASIKKQ